MQESFLSVKYLEKVTLTPTPTPKGIESLGYNQIREVDSSRDLKQQKT